MKTVDEYMKEPYRMEITPDPEEGGYVISFPDLPGCLTSGETIEKAVQNAEDAKRAWFSATIEEQITIPDPRRLEKYSGQFKLRIPRSLHVRLAEQARQEGVSMNQYCVYLLSTHMQ
ncbi:MAG: type II toxin-antitoxin system HicB family antitoxin [Solobacterium sp.]|nr:type II toxin-antitoxin system HicB family antitoxin [Solobacterium sp.]